MDPVEILIYDDIEREDAATYVSAIKAAGDAQILLRLNSDGGSVFAGYAIYNALMAHPSGVIVQIDGIAGSTASWLAMTGNPVRIAANACVVIHNPAMDISGDADDLRSQAGVLDKIKTSIIDAYVRKTGLLADQISQMMDAETWMFAEEAKAFGFVDEIIGASDVEMRFDTRRFRNPPKNFLARRTQKITAMKHRTAFINKLKTSLKVTNLADDASEDQVHDAIMAKLGDLSSYQDRLAAINTERNTHYNSIDDLYNEFGKISSAHAAAVDELGSLKKQYDTATNLAEEAKKKQAAAETDVQNKAGEIADLKNKLEVANGHIPRLEHLCRLQGVDPKEAVKHMDDPKNLGGKKTLAEWDTEMRAAKTPEARNAVRKALEKAIDEKQIAKAGNN